MTGMEIELNLVDDDGDPSMRNTEVLALHRRPRVPDRARPLQPRDQRAAAAAGRRRAWSSSRTTCAASSTPRRPRPRGAGAGMVMIGILPTLLPEHVTHEALSPRTRATPCSTSRSSPRAARTCTSSIRRRRGPRHVRRHHRARGGVHSVQLHLQVSPDEFAAHWNAAQCLAGVQVALGANSPYFLGRELWRESRIAVFTQATDTRSVELKAQGVRPRVWFGERYITSVFDLFEENLRYFPALLPVVDDEDPLAVLAGGRHAGAARAAPAQRHGLPVEPAGLRRRRRPPAPAGREPGAAGRPDGRRRAGQRRLLLRRAAGARRAATGRCGPRCRSRPRRTTSPRARRAGIDAEVYWPGYGEVPVDRAGAAPAAAAGARGAGARGASTPPSATGCSASSSARCTSGRNGAVWQADRVHALEARGPDRGAALRGDDPRVRRADARQRACARLADRGRLTARAA